MMQEERNKIERVLSSPNPTQGLASVCRGIIMERIDRQHCSDRELRFLVKDIIEAADFGCEIRFEQKTTQGQIITQSPNIVNALIGGIICLVALVCIYESEKKGLKFWWLCELFAVASSFYAGRSLASRETVTPTTTSTRVVPVTTVDEIAIRLDKLTASLMSLFNYRQIEGTHKDFLKWLQSQYSDSTDETFRKDVKRLLGRFNYRLEEYSEEKHEAFDISDANVGAPITTVPALFADDGRVLLKGHYVVPLKNGVHS